MNRHAYRLGSRRARLASSARLLSTLMIVSLGAIPSPAEPADPPTMQESIVGSWRALEYVLRDGPTHPVDGHIFFSADDWTVLFFVLDDAGEPRRASAEGGTYTLEGDRLTFRHRYNASGGDGLEGLPASDWAMTIRAAGAETAEPCRIELDGERLAIHFPSGNHMTFQRSSR